MVCFDPFAMRWGMTAISAKPPFVMARQTKSPSSLKSNSQSPRLAMPSRTEVSDCVLGSTARDISGLNPSRADRPHPALGQDLTPSSMTRRAQAGSDVRARSTRRGARVDSSRPCVAFLRISAANIGPNRFHQNRTVSWLMSIPRSARRSSTLRSDSGYLTYIITTRRMTSGELLKYRNGLLMTQAYHGQRRREHLV